MKKAIIAVFAMMFLTGCPPRPAYIAISKDNTQSGIAGLSIQPIGFFYDSRKDSAMCDIVFKFSNESDVNIDLDLLGSVLKTPSNTLPLSELCGIGLKPLSVPLILLSKSDTVINFTFTGEKNIFSDTLQVNLVSGTALHETFYFRKSNKSDKRRPL